MSTTIIPNEGEVIQAGFVRSALNGSLKLFQNNVTPTKDTVLADLTEATFSGYAAIALATADFAAVTTVSDKAQLIANSFQTFAHNGGGTNNTIYGYYFVQSGKILFCEKFDTPFTMDGATKAIVFKPKLTYNSAA
jgi:hypothetical protein